MTAHTYAFGYYGGKLSHLARLLPLLPTCSTYVEPFAGSAAVLLNRAPSPVEVYNDLDGGGVNFFKMLRERSTELISALELTLYSRAEFAEACNDDSSDDMERARRFFVRIAQSRANQPHATTSQWSYSVGDSASNASDWKYCVTHSKREMASAVSAWLGNINGLPEVVARLKTVQIECLSALDCIRRYDHSGALIYADPPYLPSTRINTWSYVHEMTEDEHVALAVELRSCVGRVALSGYNSPLYDSLYGGWFKTVWGARAGTNHETLTGSRACCDRACGAAPLAWSRDYGYNRVNSPCHKRHGPNVRSTQLGPLTDTSERELRVMTVYLDNLTTTPALASTFASLPTLPDIDPPEYLTAPVVWMRTPHGERYEILDTRDYVANLEHIGWTRDDENMVSE